jgi:hypothetical protein
MVEEKAKENVITRASDIWTEGKRQTRTSVIWLKENLTTRVTHD